jgi:Dienelactone hydrolase and related enzymes
MNFPQPSSIPKGEGPFPAVVLVHGSGPHDRDETIGPNKVFKDVAWGLATRGVAVLRYEKRTKECGNMIDIKNFTVNEETVDDALAAVELLYETPKIDKGKIFVLGHSLGGLMAPRIAALSSYHIAGLVLCAAPSDGDLLATMLRQTEYIASLDGDVNEEEAKQIRVIEDALKKLEDSKIPEDEIIIGCSKEYWLDLKAYDPIEVAQSLQIPMLILQGGHDYQVTLEDFLKWKKIYPHKPSSSIPNLSTSSFKALPHLLPMRRLDTLQKSLWMTLQIGSSRLMHRCTPHDINRNF